MGFKTPSGVEIPRLKIYDTEGEVLEVLTGPMAMDELNKELLLTKNQDKIMKYCLKKPQKKVSLLIIPAIQMITLLSIFL